MLQILWFQSFWRLFINAVHHRSNKYVFTAIGIGKVIAWLSTKQRVVNSWRKIGIGLCRQNWNKRSFLVRNLVFQSPGASFCSGSAGASVVAHSVALPLIEIAFWTLDCSIVPTCGAWGSATVAKRGPLKQSWAEIQHSRDDEPLGLLMQMRNVRVNGFFLFSSLGVLIGVFVDTLSLCSGNLCVKCLLIVLHKFYIEL